MQVDKFTFQLDFVKFDMKKDIKVPLNLGRPFIKTAKVIIHVDDNKLKIIDQEEEVNFKMSKGIHNLEPNDINAINEFLFVTSKP